MSHVDVIEKNDTNVKYVLTVQRTDGSTNVFVDGPITLTAGNISIYFILCEEMYDIQ
ncbi:hypothetical protein ACXAT3_001146 [Clostridium sporogenes]